MELYLLFPLLVFDFLTFDIKVMFFTICMEYVTKELMNVRDIAVIEVRCYNFLSQRSFYSKTTHCIN